jgi:O-antigen ligase
MSRSASGVLLLVLGVGTFIYFNKLIISKQYSVNKASYWGGGIAYFIGLIFIYYAYEFIFSLVGRDADLTDRTRIWELLLPLINENIALGFGYGAFWASFAADEFLDHWGYIGNAHNGYLEILLHGGMPMLIVFILMTTKGFINSAKNACAVQYAHQYNISLTIIIQLLIANFVAYSLPNHISFDFFVFMLVLFFANIKSKRQ